MGSCFVGVSEMSRDSGERRRLQSYDLQEPKLQIRILLGLSRAVGTARVFLVSICLHMNIDCELNPRLSQVFV